MTRSAFLLFGLLDDGGGDRQGRSLIANGAGAESVAQEQADVCPNPRRSRAGGRSRTCFGCVECFHFGGLGVSREMWSSGVRFTTRSVRVTKKNRWPAIVSGSCETIPIQARIFQRPADNSFFAIAKISRRAFSPGLPVWKLGFNAQFGLTKSTSPVTRSTDRKTKPNPSV